MCTSSYIYRSNITMNPIEGSYLNKLNIFFSHFPFQIVFNKPYMEHWIESMLRLIITVISFIFVV